MDGVSDIGFNCFLVSYRYFESAHQQRSAAMATLQIGYKLAFVLLYIFKRLFFEITPRVFRVTPLHLRWALCVPFMRWYLPVRQELQFNRKFMRQHQTLNPIPGEVVSRFLIDCRGNTKLIFFFFIENFVRAFYTHTHTQIHIHTYTHTHTHTHLHTYTNAPTQMLAY